MGQDQSLRNQVSAKIGECESQWTGKQAFEVSVTAASPAGPIVQWYRFEIDISGNYRYFNGMTT